MPQICRDVQNWKRRFPTCHLSANRGPIWQTWNVCCARHSGLSVVCTRHPASHCYSHQLQRVYVCVSVCLRVPLWQRDDLSSFLSGLHPDRTGGIRLTTQAKARVSAIWLQKPLSHVANNVVWTTIVVNCPLLFFNSPFSDVAATVEQNLIWDAGWPLI